MVTRYNATDASPDAAGAYVAYPDYRVLQDRLDALETAIRGLLPQSAKTADEQAVTDFVLTLVRKVK